jgi:hypothetical protein
LTWINSNDEGLSRKQIEVCDEAQFRKW